MSTLIVCAALQEFCPCNKRCSNQMFSRREYAKLEVVSNSALMPCMFWLRCQLQVS